MGKKILVVSTNREKYPCAVIPAGALQLTKELKDIGEDAEFLDLCFEKYYFEAFLRKISTSQPEIVIFSLRNIDNETYLNTKFYLEEVYKYIKLCQACGNITTIIGGIGFLVNYEGILKYLPVDYGIADRGFDSIFNLIRNFGNKEKIDSIDNLVYMKEGKVIGRKINKIQSSAALLDWNFILSHCSPQYLISDDNRKGPASIGLQTKNGCHSYCIHCQIPEIEGNKITPYPYEYILDTFKVFEDFGIKECFITDNLFNYPYDHAITLCRKMAEAKISINWSCYLTPKYVDTDLITAMKKAGCRNVQFGLDTASDSLLSLWKKGYTKEDIIRAGKICAKEHMNSSFSLMVGGLGETGETLKESLETLKAAEAKFIWGALGVRIQVRTGLWELLIKEGRLDENKDLLKPEFYLSPGIIKEYSQIVEDFKTMNPDILVKINEG